MSELENDEEIPEDFEYYDIDDDGPEFDEADDELPSFDW